MILCMIGINMLIQEVCREINHSYCNLEREPGAWGERRFTRFKHKVEAN